MIKTTATLIRDDDGVHCGLTDAIARSTVAGRINIAGRLADRGRRRAIGENDGRAGAALRVVER